MKISSLIHVIVSIPFIGMAALQLNDPDPLLWIAFYLLVAAIPLARSLGHRLPRAVCVTAGFALACLLMSLPGFVEYLDSKNYASIGGAMVGDRPYVESAREVLGAAIAMSCLCFYWRWHVGTSHA